jgi:hypothetical protein
VHYEGECAWAVQTSHTSIYPMCIMKESARGLCRRFMHLLSYVHYEGECARAVQTWVTPAFAIEFFFKSQVCACVRVCVCTRVALLCPAV